MWAIRTAPYARAKISAESSKAPGTQSAAIRSEAIAPKMTSRTAPSSGSTTLVSQAYPPQHHHSTARTARPFASPVQVGSPAISAVHWVIARTKTSSSGVTRSSSRRTAVRRRVAAGAAVMRRLSQSLTPTPAPERAVVASAYRGLRNGARGGHVEARPDVGRDRRQRLRGLARRPLRVPRGRDPARRDDLAELDHDRALVLEVDREARHERDAEARGRITLHGLVVVGAKHDVRLEPDRAELTRHRFDPLARPERHQGKPREVGKHPRRTHARVLRAGLRNEDVRLREHLLRRERPRRQREVDERDVEDAAFERAQELEVVMRLVQLDVHVGEHRDEPLQDGRKQPRADALVRADPQWAGRPARERVDVRLRGAEPRLDRGRVGEQGLARDGEAEGLLAVDALDDAHPDDPLQAGDLLADRRLRVAEAAGGAVERALVGDGLQRCEMAELEPQPGLGGFAALACLTDEHAD